MRPPLLDLPLLYLLSRRAPAGDAVPVVLENTRTGENLSLPPGTSLGAALDAALDRWGEQRDGE